MRDYVILGLIVGLAPVCLFRPYVGVLVWTWVSLMNPHRLAWGMVKYFPVAQLIGGATLLGLFFSKESKRMPPRDGLIGIVATWLCLSLSTLYAWNPEEAIPAWNDRTKTLFMVLVTMAVIHDRDRLRQLCVVAAASVGFYGFKGGVFAALTGAEWRVWGPPGSYIGSNNAIALALNMTLPMLFYLGREFEDWRWRWLCRATFLLSMLAIISTHSRGGFLGMVVVMGMLFLKNRRRLLGAMLLAVVLVAGFAFAPESWTHRMQTITTYESDGSAMSRLHAWKLAWRLALARPLFGWGPQGMEDKSLYDDYYPDSPSRNDVHSSYFQHLAEGGFVGFGVFVGFLAWALVRTQILASRFRRHPTDEWIAHYADMFQISMLAFAVCATFLEKAFFDLFYTILGMTTVLNGIAQPLVGKPAPIRQPSGAPNPLLTLETAGARGR